MTHCDNIRQARVFEAAIEAFQLHLPFQEEDDNG